MMGEHDDEEFKVIKQQVASEIWCYPPEISVLFTCSYARESSGRDFPASMDR
jgi:hypothetical protein